ncbi:MAG TPA: ATP-binding protein [Candidatus Acidoferrum sp.]|nr:ATP-binding protein [Candidatus Acidoferrum sp.]
MNYPPQWETSIPNRLPALMRANEELDRCLEQWGADANARYLAQLAVEELGTNIIKYGYDDQAEHLIRLGAIVEETFFRIRLEDDGHEFNPCLTPEPDPNLGLQERKPGGWGLSLLRRLLAGMEYERRDGRNLLSVLVPRQSASPGS